LAPYKFLITCIEGLRPTDHPDAVHAGGGKDSLVRTSDHVLFRVPYQSLILFKDAGCGAAKGWMGGGGEIID
jgi:hypothetical protein